MVESLPPQLKEKARDIAAEFRDSDIGIREDTDEQKLEVEDSAAIEFSKNQIFSEEEQTAIFAKIDTLKSESIASNSESLSPEAQEYATKCGMNAVSNALKDAGIKYVTFGSTAKWLIGHKFQDPELSKNIPGDFDAVILTGKDGDKEQMLNKAKEALSRLPGFEFGPPPSERQKNTASISPEDYQYKVLAGEALVLQGTLRMVLKDNNGNPQVINYELELFADTFIVDEKITKYQEDIAGILSLNLEGLKRQYLNNYEFENTVYKDVNKNLRALLLAKRRGDNLNEYFKEWNIDSEKDQEFIVKLLNQIDEYEPDPLARLLEIDQDPKKSTRKKVIAIFSGGLKYKNRQKTLQSLGVKDIPSGPPSDSKNDLPMDQDTTEEILPPIEAAAK